MVHQQKCLIVRSFLLTVLPVVTLLALQTNSLKMTWTHLTIIKTWNNESVDPKHHVNIDLLYGDDLQIKVSAPFYDDPHLPDMTKHPGTMEKLYNYEVVEVFLLGENQHYLEIELAPKGQYLVLELKGYRNVTRYPIDLSRYEARVNGHGWTGVAVVPKSLLPPKTSHINAYAIHGTGDNRTYLSLYPAPVNHPNYTAPDFHKLELFKPISIFNKPN